MPWGRIDDDFHDGPKVAELLEEPEGLAAIGLWTLMFSWAHRNTRRPGRTPGLLPRSKVVAVDRVNASRYAGLLCKVGLWESREDGWMIHNFTRYLPKPATSAARSEAGRKGGQASGRSRSEARSLQEEAQSFENEAQAKQARSKTLGMGIGSSKELEVVGTSVVVAEIRADVERLCTRLADAIEANGSRRPRVTQGWRTACRLMIDKDGLAEDQIARCIDWCQGDEFWRSNILSMPKLREKYDQLRLAAQRGRAPRGATTDQRVSDALSLLDP